MAYQFEILNVTDGNGVLPRRLRIPMTLRSYEGCTRWLERVVAGAPSDPNLLTLDVRNMGFLDARSGVDNIGAYVAFHPPHRSDRFVMPAQFCFMRLLSLPGGQCRWSLASDSKKNQPSHLIRRYLTYGDRTAGLRILYDAKPGEVMLQRIKRPTSDHRGHYDLRPHNIDRTTHHWMRQEGKPMRAPVYGRLEAIDYAVAAFQPGTDIPLATRDDYRALLERASAHLDIANNRG